MAIWTMHQIGSVHDCYVYEGMIPVMDSLGRYVKRHGIPLAVYTDQHATYHSPALPSMDDHLVGAKPRSQFGRALRESGVELIQVPLVTDQGPGGTLFKMAVGSDCERAALSGLYDRAANRLV